LGDLFAVVARASDILFWRNYSFVFGLFVYRHDSDFFQRIGEVISSFEENRYASKGKNE